MTDDERAQRLRALHGWALLAHRDSEEPEDMLTARARVKAYEEALRVIEDGFVPFDDDDMRERYRDVSKSVREADRAHVDRANGDERTVGVQ